MAVITHRLRSNLATAFLLVLSGIALWRWLETRNIYFLLVLLRDILGAYFFFRRVDPVVMASRWQTAVAFVSTAVPVVYMAPANPTLFEWTASRLLAVIGYLLVTMATIDLWEKFGVTAAKRGAVVRTGVYRFNAHPMYVGYAIAELGPSRAFLRVGLTGLKELGK